MAKSAKEKLDRIYETRRSASKAYRDRMKAQGYKQATAWIPEESEEEFKTLVKRLGAEYEARKASETMEAPEPPAKQRKLRVAKVVKRQPAAEDLIRQLFEQGKSESLIAVELNIAKLKTAEGKVWSAYDVGKKARAMGLRR